MTSESQNNPQDSEAGSSPVNKLQDGPCGKQYALLQQCATRNGVTNSKQQLQACPSETDMLITCVNKHPLFFQT
jgi:hypothetical protein